MEKAFHPPGRQPHRPRDARHGFGIVDPRLHPGNRLGHPRIQPRVPLRRGDLRLMPRALRGQERRRHLPRQGRPMAACDQMQHQVLRRCRTPHGYPIAINDIAVGQAFHLWEGGREILQIFPMHGRPVPVQQPRPRHHPCPRIHPRDQPEPGRHPPQGLQKRPRRHLGLPIAHDHHQHIRPLA